MSSKTIMNGGKILSEEETKDDYYRELKTILLKYKFYNYQKFQDFAEWCYKHQISLKLIDFIGLVGFIIKAFSFTISLLCITFIFIVTIAFLCGSFFKLTLFFAR